MAEHVALVKRVCRVCHKEVDAEIVVATRYFNGEPLTDLSQYHGKVVGFLEEPCDDCKEKFRMDEYNIILEFDEAKTDDRNDPYCTGRVLQVRKDTEFAKVLPVKNGMCYASTTIVNEIVKRISGEENEQSL
jgi:hypothetical protein